jgi:tetratricopeptide (TPR) repeat protein
MNEFPREGQEIEIKYKITNYKGDIIDSTEGKPNFKFTLGKTNIIKSITDNLLIMTKGSKKTIEINIEQEPNIFDVFSDVEKQNLNLENLPQNSNIVKCELELINFHDKIKSIFELTNDEKFDKAKKMKLKFVEEYKNKKYKEGIISLDESMNFIEKINNKDYLIEEIKKFKLSLLLNKCNCYNNLKEYPSTVKIGKEIIENDDKCLKAYYYLGTALAYLDEFEEAMKNYNKLYELISDKKDPGIIALLDLINKRKKSKEDNIRKKFKAYLSSKEK